MTIDGKYISAWSVVLLDGSYSPLFKYHTRKEVQFTNYAERDGITPDLRKIEFKTKSVSLNFLMRHNSVDDFWEKYKSFFSDMTAPGYRIMIPGNGLTHVLRYDKTAKYESPRLYSGGDNITLFTLNFLEDNPAILDSQSPVGGISLRGSYAINGIDFGEFGIHPDGEIGKVLHYPDVKTPFTDGETLDLDTRRLKHKEITLPLWMLSNSQEEFVRNYSAFFTQFNRPGKQSLYIKEIGGTTFVYYVDCTDFTVFWGKRPGAKFSIKIVIPVVTWMDGTTNIYTVLSDVLGLLADENGNVIAINR